MSDDAKFAEAYQALGKYFSEFSALERELGEAVKAVLNQPKAMMRPTSSLPH
jgi:hypothetical protein